MFAAPPAAAQTAAHTFTLTGPATITETNSDANTRYTLTRSGPEITEGGFRILQITWAVTAGTATAADFSGGSLPTVALGFTGTETSKDFDIGIAGDNLPEADETFTITFFIAPGGAQTNVDANGGATLPADFTITILANDGQALAISVDDANTEEGDTAEFTVTLIGEAPTSPVTVDWAVSGDVDSSDHDATGGTLTFTAADSQTIRIAIASDFDAESAEDLTVTLSNPSSGVTFANAADNAATTTIATSTLARRLTLAGPAAATEGEDSTYTVSLQGTAFANPTAVTWTITHTDTTASDFAAATGSIMFPTMTTFAISVLDDAATEPAEAFSVQISTADANANAVGAAVQTTIGGDDDPAARAARVKTPMAITAGHIGQLTANAVSQRLHFDGASAFNLAPAATAEELLRQSRFSLAHADGGINLWANGGHVSAKGDQDGIAYDGGTTALHLGADAVWNNGLLGIAITRSDSDMAFNNTDNLETEVTSVHPYLTRKFTNIQLWTTIGRGSGDAELKEPDAVIKTDLTVTTAALGAVYAPVAGVALSADGVYTRAQLDAAQSAGRRLPKVTADALRLNAAAELSGRRDAWRSFLTVKIRHDAGDGDTGTAGDLGGGVEWQSPTVNLRLEGSKYLIGSGAEEERITLTASKITGRLNLGLNLTAHNGLNTADLLTGELRF